MAEPDRLAQAIAGAPVVEDQQPTGFLDLARRILGSALTGNYLSPRGDIHQDISDYAGDMGRNAMTDIGQMALHPESFIGPGPLGMARVPSLMGRIASAPRAPTREWLPSDFTLHRFPDWESAGPMQRRMAVGANWAVSHPDIRGMVSAYVNPQAGTLHVAGSHLNSYEQGQGIGLAMYRRMIDEAHRHGYRVFSDADVSPEAQRIYGALADPARGYRVVRHPAATLDEWGGLHSPSDIVGVYEVLPPLPLEPR